MSKSRIYLSPPNVDSSENRAALQALESGWIAPVGPALDQFEQELSQHFKKKVLLLNSGTSALHLSLILAGIKPGDYVLTSAMTFAACANVIRYQQGIPILVDSESQTWNMDPELLDSYLRGSKIKPKAVILTHLHGVPARLTEIKKITENYEIILIEDAAEALGSTYDTVPVGSVGDFGILSFNGNKIVTTSGGGALICDEDNYHKALHLATQANRGTQEYDHDLIGYNYRMSNILAGIGLSQFEKLDAFAKRKYEINGTYRERLARYFQFPASQKSASSNYWLTTALIESNIKPSDLIGWLEKEDIESRRIWKPLHLHKAYQRFKFVGEGVCVDLFEQGICLPSGSGLTEAEQERVIAAIEKFFLS